MIKIKNVEVLPMENAGCNNGNYPMMVISTNQGEFKALTCNCGSGCSGTCRIPAIGWEFDSIDQMWEELEA